MATLLTVDVGATLDVGS